MQLKPLTHGPKKNRFCGPAIISFITGLTTDQAAAQIRKRTGRRNVMGTHSGEVSGTLRDCGYRMIGHDSFGKTKPTLAKWLKDNKHLRTAGRVFVIDAGNHWQIITGQRYACGIVGEIVSVRDDRVKRRARVNDAYEIVYETDAADARAKTKAVQDALEQRQAADRKHTNRTSAARRRAKALADKHGIEIEVDDFGEGRLSIYAFPPERLSAARESGQVDYDAVAFDWHECEAMIEKLVQLMSEIQLAA